MWRRSRDYDPNQEQLFAKDVDRGLSSHPRALSSRWFYDETGDRLFQQIMHLPEYYLTRTEYGILQHYAAEILALTRNTGLLNLVELGAGDGLKTRILLRSFSVSDLRFRYVPIDISAHALEMLGSALRSEFPSMQVFPLQADYFSALGSEELNQEGHKLVLFLGSNVGNMVEEECLAFYRNLNRVLQPGDFVLTGFDLVKNPETILSAYNDSSGITCAFNLNLLKRINQELGANFDLLAWEHKPVYDPLRKAALSFLVSLKEQEVFIRATGKSYRFGKAEQIATEISRKFEIEDVEALAKDTGFSVVRHFTDAKSWFLNSLWKKSG